MEQHALPGEIVRRFSQVVGNEAKMMKTRTSLLQCFPVWTLSDGLDQQQRWTTGRGKIDVLLLGSLIGEVANVETIEFLRERLLDLRQRLREYRDVM